MDNELLPSEGEHHLEYHFKSHSLIYSSLDFTSRMMNIYALMLTEMKEQDWFDKNGDHVVPEYTFSSDVLCDWFKVTKRELYAILKKPCQGLAQKEIGVEEDGKFRYRPVLSDIQYDRGTLTISPNGKLRETYIINAGNNGHGKIDNKIFKLLGNPNSKRVFEFLCRYRYEKEMYFTSVSKLQIMFGIKRDDGTIKKSGYAKQSSFINKVIKPALKEIAECPYAQDKLEVLEKDGNMGFELVDTADGVGSKLRFLVKWKNKLTKEQIVEASQKATSLIERIKVAKQTNNDTLPLLIELESQLRLLSKDDQANEVSIKVKELKAKMAKKKQIEERQDLTDAVAKVDLAFSSDLLDGL